ncbi:MAG: hypothetical protein NC299_15190 [Lachnospiraceae bacterium]|nr:hypothetical protein [Ruminococcus sp.]MCM1276679.1 hypothetical protein [Lachnospiraceae bacterium]
MEGIIIKSKVELHKLNGLCFNIQIEVERIAAILDEHCKANEAEEIISKCVKTDINLPLLLRYLYGRKYDDWCKRKEKEGWKTMLYLMKINVSRKLLNEKDDCSFDITSDETTSVSPSSDAIAELLMELIKSDVIKKE